MTVNLGAGTAEMQVNNLALGDYFTKASAFGPNWATAFVPATVSFDVVWSAPVTRRLNFQDTTSIDQFGGAFVENRATVTWSGTNANGFTFTANPGDFSTSFNAFAELAHVQNGIFFGAEDEHGDGQAGESGQAGGQTALDPVRLVGVLSPSGPAPATTGPTSQGAETHTAAGKDQPLQPALALQPLAAGAADHRVLDQVFADLDGSTLSDVLRGDASPAWSV